MFHELSLFCYVFIAAAISILLPQNSLKIPSFSKMSNNNDENGCFLYENSDKYVFKEGIYAQTYKYKETKKIREKLNLECARMMAIYFTKLPEAAYKKA